jgi:lysophospholipid acyltransferase (LPLAT)-like uncharacterized protein
MKGARSAWWIGLLGANVIRAFGATWRVRITGRFEVEPRIYALLHGNLLLPSFRLRKTGAVIMISRHRDGEMIAQAIERLGFRTVRGSSTRGGGFAARDLIEQWPDRPWVVTPDGPKGPRGSVKEGLIRLAENTGRPIQPLVGAARPAKVFSSWDRFALPLPFARIVIHFGEPLAVPSGLAPAERERFARELERRLEESEKTAQQQLASW